MRKVVFFLAFTLIQCAPKQEFVSSEIKIDSKNKTLLSEDFEFIIAQIISDSRCPENVNCIWEGEAEVLVSIFKKGVFYKNETIVFNSKNIATNKLLFETYTNKKLIESINFLPINKDGKVISVDDYKIVILFKKN